MKGLFSKCGFSLLLLLVAFSAQAQSELENKIESVFLHQPTPGEGYDKKAKISQLGSQSEVRVVLLRMLTTYKHYEPGGKEYLLLAGATSVLGEIEEKQAVAALSQMLFDKNVHENVRAMAARSLGQIDTEGNKQVLLKALANKDDYFAVRVFAAEALGKTKDAEVLKALEKYRDEEADSHVRQKFEKAAQELKSRLRRP